MKKLVFVAVAAVAFISVSNVFAATRNIASVQDPVEAPAPADTTSTPAPTEPAPADTIQ